MSTNDTNVEDKTRAEQSLRKKLLCVCTWGLIILGLALVSMVFLPYVIPGELSHRFLVSRLAFFSVCLFTAVFQLVLGVLLALIGVSADYDVGAGWGGAKLRLVCSSPGILLIICANILMGICIFRNVELEVNTTEISDIPPTQKLTPSQFEVPKLEPSSEPSTKPEEKKEGPDGFSH